MLALSILTILLSSQPPLLLSSDLGGDAMAGCHGEREPLLAAVAAAHHAHPEALYIDTGDLVGTSYVAQVLVHERLPDLVSLLHALDLRALVLGHRDLAGDRGTLLIAARAFAAAGLPYVATNFRGGGVSTVPSVALSDHTVVLAAISPAAIQGIADRTGVVLSDPVEAIRAAAAKARAEGATRVIAVFDPSGAGGTAEAIDFAARLQGAADVVIIRGADKRVLSAELQGGVHVIAAARGAVLSPPADQGAPDADFAARSRALNEWLCATHARALPPVQASALAAFSALTLDVMREHAHAEVAVLNTHVLRDDVFPLPNAPTELDVRTALPFDNHLRLAWIKGADLRKVYADNQSRLLFRGIVAEGKIIKVNGRPIDDTSWYRVVTIDFLADGGDGAKLAPRFTAVDSSPLPELVLRALRAREPEALALDRHTRWWIHYTLELDLASTSVTNPSPTVLSDTQLSRGQALALSGDSLFRAFADHPAYSFENTVHLQYGVSRTIDTTGLDSGVVNNTDLIAGRSTGIYRRVFGAPHWYLPVAYADMYIESEFTRPNTRPYQHLLLQPTAGARLELTPFYALYVGGGLGWEALARPSQLPPPQAPVYPVLVTGWMLRPTKLATFGERSITAESNLDIYWTRSLGVPSTQIRFRARIAVPIFSILSLTATDEVFAHYLRPGNTLWGYSNDLTAGIQVAYDRAFQAFHL